MYCKTAFVDCFVNYSTVFFFKLVAGLFEKLCQNVVSAIEKLVGTIIKHVVANIERVSTIVKHVVTIIKHVVTII